MDGHRGNPCYDINNNPTTSHQSTLPHPCLQGLQVLLMHVCLSLRPPLQNAFLSFFAMGLTHSESTTLSLLIKHTRTLGEGLKVKDKT